MKSHEYIPEPDWGVCFFDGYLDMDRSRVVKRAAKTMRKVSGSRELNRTLNETFRYTLTLIGCAATVRRQLIDYSMCLWRLFCLQTVMFVLRIYGIKV